MSDSYRISERTVERIASVATKSVPGTVNQDAKLAGLAGRSLPRFTASIDRPAGLVTIDAEIAVAFPAPAKAIAERVRQTITSRVQTFTGYTVSRVNVTIVAFAPSPTGARVTRDEVRHHRVEATLRPIQVPSKSIVHPEVLPQQPLRAVSVAPALPVRAPLTPPKPVDVWVPQTPTRLPLVSDFPVVASYAPQPVVVPEPTPVFVPSVPEPLPLRPIAIQPGGDFQ
ncbi:Asp23/Gls24 family envelope stress response protein [Corynebacterium breve]|uniref:Asp23/Gls24 family envelope stress response protein n=1 Tax=Corynebacterium breve TaxID=3049799 RepID=A0ABY8VGH7_9CORY|nr:Asp23/Gls24 family envelope stress response protein [Corynebacterium breve]WIM68076.1 Asp23/Gls24 family envelope stress response protein [Corynebacterium breve]